MNTTTITNRQDIIDSRDIIERIAELDSTEDLDDDERAELESLEAFAEEAKGYAADWEYGAAFIRDSYFEDYAQELAEDLDLVDTNASWPMNCIDWESAARHLKMDYTSIDFDGVTYWVRAY